MSTTVRRRRPEEFQIHEDVPSSEDTQMNTDALAEEEEEEDAEQDEQEEEQEPELEEDEEESDGDEDMDEELRTLQNAFPPGFKQKYRLQKRIGEGKSRPRPSLLLWPCPEANSTWATLA